LPGAVGAVGALLGVLVLAPSDAHAQFGPGGGMRPMGPGMGGPGAGQPPPEKPEGPAEEAPDKDKTPDVATEALPAWPGQREKTLQFLQLNGYLRGRGFFWHNLNLGHFNDPSLRANPFTIPYSELPPAMGQMANPFSCAGSSGHPCNNDNIKTADMRFRLEPTLNISEQVRVKAQIDIFDNLVMGSTPEGFYINGRGGTTDAYPSIYGRTQVPQESAINALQSSIRAKRVWGEIKTPLFELAFGRMPLMWGTGMLFHDGNCFTGTYNDCDFGVNVDRVMATARLWGHFVSLSWDWAAVGPTSQIVYNQQLIGWHYNADNVDDVNQWTLALGRKDSEEEIADRLRRGESVFNYGAFLMLRTQDWDLNYNPRPQVTPQNQARDTAELYPATDVIRSLGRRSAWSLTPDIYARLDWRKLHLELEGAAVFGNIGELDLPSSTGAPVKSTVRLQQFGGLIRGHYKLLRDSLKIAMEVGSASGPQNGDPRGELNWRRAQESPSGPVSEGVTSLRNTRFTFDPDYHVDLILFRRILGTVYNSTYFKPSVTYWLIDNFGGQVDLIYSLANRPATFPGHAINMGVEIDARLMYKNEEEGFYAMLEYGVLFNLGALEQKGAMPGDPWYPQTPPTLPPPNGTTAQVFQAKIMLKF
jgi:uncharacterized protein (TIGR04551 family)